ncbi:SGNH/GDSL hydrolase family protein [Nostoc cf. edaphicum LEGE 07299]|uniref:SGNH/GDSL hydrolase family protein n=1 Tax=Nostoc cf. edaphicum LEGE 07299 TaxID=2777974 RepID=A0ABR9TUI2_9NOSO|nr:SGNH/GDSL hydrolase family protein [Nostoc edaphicum]MBE9104066.1 SGNH/GDSL hydrolase family protein [Nostoc cf. edaphicum LEGE 07299]
MQRQIITTGFLLLSLIFPLKVLAKDYDNIYVFGDSFSDTGNVFNATNGIIPPSPTYSNGRFSDGPIWVDYLASDLGLTLNLKNNFAFGGATTGTENIGLPSLPGLQQQINSFVSAQTADPNALYIIWAGTNDYLSYFFGGVPNPTNTVGNLSTALTSLVTDGARDIMVVNLPDLGKLPFANFDSQRSNLFNTFSSTHNSSLNTTLKSLRQQLSPDINIMELNVNSLFDRIIAAPDEFGFTNVTNSCISKDLSVVPIDVPTQQVLCNPEKFVFWDEVHPTTTTHKLIGELAFSSLKPLPVPEPSAELGILAYSVLGAVSLLKRKIPN